MSQLTKLNIAAIADRYAAAWIARDPKAIIALHAPESTFQAHGRGVQVKGKPALLKEFTEAFERYPNFGVETRRLLLGDKHWTLDWDLTFQPPGKSLRKFHALDVVEVDDAGLITKKDTFFDFAQVKAALEAA
jgi:hypothetical protein